MAAKFKMAGANGSGRGWPKTIYCQNQKRYTVKIKNGILSKSKTIYCQNQKRYTFFCQIKVFNFILTRLINAINYSHTLILKVYYASENRDPTKGKKVASRQKSLVVEKQARRYASYKTKFFVR